MSDEPSAVAVVTLPPEFTDQISEAFEVALRNALGKRAADETLLDRAATCVRYGQTPRQLEHLVRTGKIPFTRVGRRIMFSTAAMDEWVKSNTVTPR